jgi:integrase
MALTVKELQALTATDKGRILTAGGSLKGQVYVARDGTVSVQFRFAFKFEKASKNILIGTWPRMGLAEVRQARDQYRAEIQEARKTNSLDPVKQRKLAKLQQDAAREVELVKIEADKQEALLEQQNRLQNMAARNARITVLDLFKQWKKFDLVNRADKGSEAERSFNRDVFPMLGELAAADVTKAHVQEIVDNIKGRATASRDMVRTAKKTLAELRQMFGFALDRDYIEADPTARIKKAKIGKDVERDRVLTQPELVMLFQKLPIAGMADTSRLALLLQLATITRIGEVLSARWEHVDFERRIWTLPETKNGKRHEIWLSDFALDQLKQLHSITGLTPWLFPATRTKNDSPDFADHVCEKTVTRQVGDRQRPGTEPMSGRSKQTAALVLAKGKWTPHDLRRTGATLMAELGAMPDTVEKCLNHTEEKKVKRIYQRARYEAPMRAAWRLLGERLELLKSNANGAAENIVPLKNALRTNTLTTKIG